MTTMECLPSDIELDILSRLPFESVLDCKLVSKRLWNLLTREWDLFVRMHHQHQVLQLASNCDASSSSAGLLFSFAKWGIEERKVLHYGDEYNNEMNIHDNYYSYTTLQKTSVSFHCEDESGGIVGSCNGLICLVRYHHGIPDPIHICNPNTGEYVNLPEYTLREKDTLVVFGFGYVNSLTGNQYKVVRICYPGSDGYEEGEVQVYTIGSGSGWRTIGTTSYRLFKDPSRRGMRVNRSLQWVNRWDAPYQLYQQPPKGTFVNGSLHWIDLHKIVAFDLADEEFRVIPSPPCHDYLRNHLQRLQALRGNLCFSRLRKNKNLLDIWCLKKNGRRASWSRDFSIAYESLYEEDFGFPAVPLLITKKNEVVFVHRGSVICFYDPKTNTVTEVWDEDEQFEVWGITAVPHMNSFVSLKALGERSEMKKKVIV